MKYNVGDLVLVKHCKCKSLHTRPYPQILPRFHRLPDSELFNSYGIVTQAIKHGDIWGGESTNSDNIYVWFSQVDGTEYKFYEDEVIGEVIK